MDVKPAVLFKALGVETRLKIIELLKSRKSVGAKEIAEELGITTAAVSQHLKILRHIGLVNSRREGYFIPYSIDEKALEHCSMMMNDVCSCHQHHPFHDCNGNFSQDLTGKSREELMRYRQVLEARLQRVNRLLDGMKD
jgi:DNA-binding transcriptional ArsR family regulator